MTIIQHPSTGPASWRQHLADPEKHWRRGRSAFECAYSWELAAGTKRGLPVSVAKVLDQVEALRGSEALIVLPEHKTPLPGGSRPSQTDVWALLTNSVGRVSLAVEGKAGESFGPTIDEWLKDASEGKQDRLRFLQDLLGLPAKLPGTIRYQLLHRTAAALLEAARWQAGAAVMLVQTFVPELLSRQDFDQFAATMGLPVGASGISDSSVRSGTTLYLAWVESPLVSDGDIAKLAG